MIKKRCRILLVDDHQVVLGGIKSILDEHPEFEIVAEALSGREALAMATLHKPDIVIMDISMQDMSGIEATLKIKQNDPETRIIIYTMHSDSEYVTDLLRAGISAYVLKEDSMSDLIHAIHEVRKGGSYFSRIAPWEVADRVRKIRRTDKLGRQGDIDLSPREREVLQLLAEGHSIRDIAEKLDVSPKTVETHKSNIMHKLNAHSLADLTRISIRKKLIEP